MANAQLIPVSGYTREYIGTSYTAAASGADLGGTSSVVFKILVACTKIRVLYGNYYPNGGEKIFGLSVLNVSASIQTVANTGTPVLLTFGSGGSVNLNPGQMAYSDVYTVPGGLAAGAYVAILTYVQVPNSGQFPLGPQTLNNGVTGYTGTGGDNYTQRTAVPANANGQQKLTFPGGASSGWTASASNQGAYGPISIEGIASDGASRPIVALCGDSIMQGAFDADDSTGGAAVRSMVANLIPYYNLGSNGESTNNVAQGGFSARQQRVNRCTAIVEQYGTNDLNNANQTYAQLKSLKLNFWTLLTQFNGAPIIPVTLLPRPTSASFPASTQTVNTALAAYQSYNAWLRAAASAGAGNSARYDAAQVGVTIPYIIDAASYIETDTTNTAPGGPSAPSTGGRWYCGAGNATSYSSDGVHPSTAATLLIQPAYDGAKATILATAPVASTPSVAIGGSHFIRRF